MALKPNEQLRLLTKIWGRTEKGFVFLPWIPVAQARTAARKRSWKEGKAFQWPEDKVAIQAHLEQHKEDELYFAPMVFSGKARQSDLAMKSDRLWADLDEADPNHIEEDLKPTHAWETSPGRFAAVWEMTSDQPEAYAPGMENHRLTMHLGADPSGWDITQLLRVPGSANNKPGRPEGTRGKLLWSDRGRHDWDAFDELPPVEVVDAVSIDNLSEKLIDAVDRHAIWAKVRLKVSRRVREYMRMKDTAGLDRSETAWQIARDLADAGCEIHEIVAIMRPSIWNKFEGRQDELKRLMIEASKAVAQVSKSDADRNEALEESLDDDEAPKPEGLVSFQVDESFLNVPRPKWMIRDLWIEGGVGFIAGAPKSMKSWLALHMAFAVATRTNYWEHSIPKSRPVLYIQQEDDVNTVKHRLGIIVDSQDDRYHWHGVMRLNDAQQVEWHPPTVTPSLLSVTVQSGFTASNAGWQVWLEEMIAAHDIGLVVMDTLMTVSGGIDIDSAREVKGEMLDPLKIIARQHNCAMIFVHHNTKGGQNNRGAMNMSGSGQIHAWADCGIYVHERNGNELKIEIENKHGANRTTHLSLDSMDLDKTPDGRSLWLPREVVKEESGTGTVTAADIANATTPRGKRGAGTGKISMQQQKKLDGEANRQKVQDCLDAGMTSTSSIAMKTGMSASTVARHLKALRDAV